MTERDIREAYKSYQGEAPPGWDDLVRILEKTQQELRNAEELIDEMVDEAGNQRDADGTTLGDIRELEFERDHYKALYLNERDTLDRSQEERSKLHAKVEDLEDRLEHEEEVSKYWVNKAVDRHVELERMKGFAAERVAETADQYETIKDQHKRIEYLRAVSAGKTRRLAFTEQRLERAEEELEYFERYKEYTQAGFATLYHERRYGPAPGAPGTEKLLEDYTVNYKDGPRSRVVRYPIPPEQQTPATLEIPAQDPAPSPNPAPDPAEWQADPRPFAVRDGRDL